MKKTSRATPEAAALADSHPLLVMAKKWAKKLRKEMSSATDRVSLMKAQQIVCRQLSYDSLHALRAKCIADFSPNDRPGAYLSMWPSAQLAPKGLFPLGETPQGLLLAIDEAGLANNALCLHAPGSDSGAPLRLAIEALRQGKSITWIASDGRPDDAATLHREAIALGRGADVRRVCMGPPRMDDALPATRFSRALHGGSGGLAEAFCAATQEDGPNANANSMWRGRAISLLSSVLMALVHLRDRDGEPLTIEALGEALGLEWVARTARRDDLPPHVQASLRAYLRSLPGFSFAVGPGEIASEQHGFLQMQYGPLLDRLAKWPGAFEDGPGGARLDRLAERSSAIFLLDLPPPSADEERSPWETLATGFLLSSMASRLGRRLDESAHEEPTEPGFDRLVVVRKTRLPKGFSTMPAQCRAVGIAMCLEFSSWAEMDATGEADIFTTRCALAILDEPNMADPRSATAFGPPPALGKGALPASVGRESFFVSGRGERAVLATPARKPPSGI